MKRAARPPTESTPSRIRAESERRLSPEDFDAWVNAAWDDEDRERTLALIRWFKRRYPTPLERLRAGRKAARNARELSPTKART